MFNLNVSLYFLPVPSITARNIGAGGSAAVKCVWDDSAPLTDEIKKKRKKGGSVQPHPVSLGAQVPFSVVSVFFSFSFFSPCDSNNYLNLFAPGSYK